jgi:type II secretory pathway component GspD/PulD (secretin)
MVGHPTPPASGLSRLAIAFILLVTLGGYATAQDARPRNGNGGSRRAAAGDDAGAKAGPSTDKPAASDATKADDVTILVGPQGVSIFAVSADAHTVLTKLASATGMPLIVDDTVDRAITVNIVNKKPREILDCIVDAYGFSFAVVEGVSIVSEGIPSKPSSYLLSSIDSIPTRYVQPSQAKQLLPIFLQEHVKTNYSQNSVVLSAPEPVLRKFRQDVEQFDVPAAQITLDVMVVEFTDVDTDTLRSIMRAQNADFGLSVNSLTGQLSFQAILDLPTQFFSSLHGLVEARRARVRANPRIATVSGKQATIFIGKQQYLKIPVTLDSGTSNSIDAGVSLVMTPLTGGEGEIIIDLNEEISTLGAPDAITGLPDKTTRSANTTVRVQDGKTIVIGGLAQEELRETRTHTPVLGDIPLIGKLFDSKRVEKTKVDLAIFITARLLSRTGHLPTEEENAVKARFLENPQPEGVSSPAPKPAASQATGK